MPFYELPPTKVLEGSGSRCVDSVYYLYQQQLLFNQEISISCLLSGRVETILYKNCESIDLVAFSRTIHIELGNLASSLSQK